MKTVFSVIFSSLFLLLRFWRDAQREKTKKEHSYHLVGQSTALGNSIVRQLTTSLIVFPLHLSKRLERCRRRRLKHGDVAAGAFRCAGTKRDGGQRGRQARDVRQALGRMGGRSILHADGPSVYAVLLGVLLLLGLLRAAGSDVQAAPRDPRAHGRALRLLRRPRASVLRHEFSR